MYNGEIRKHIITIFQSEPQDSQDSFISDLRRSLSETHSQYNKTATLLLVLIGSHYLSISGLDSSVKLFGTDFPDSPRFHSAILLIASLVFFSLTCLSYLKKYQRECYILSLMMRFPNINKTGLHELRLPSNALLAADMLRYDSDGVQRAVGVFSWKVLSYANFTLPFVYILYFSGKSVWTLSSLDIFVSLCVLLSSCLCLVSSIFQS